MLAGPPTQLTLASDPGCERLAVTNGSEAASRLLLSGAALQLMDEHGNASTVSGQSVRVSLQWPPEAEGVPSLTSLPFSWSCCLSCMQHARWRSPVKIGLTALRTTGSKQETSGVFLGDVQ